MFSAGSVREERGSGVQVPMTVECTQHNVQAVLVFQQTGE